MDLILKVMKRKLKKQIEEKLECFYFVMWDRYTYDKIDDVYAFYGWIDRQKDFYKDFIELEFYPTDPDERGFHWFFSTSSVEYHSEICRILDFVEDNSNQCIRIEKDFDVANVIKLSTGC